MTGGIPPELGRLSNLTRLLLHSNRLTGEIPPELGLLGFLKLLVLSGNQLTGEIPPGLGGLSHLTQLALHRNQLTGEIPPELGRLSNLTTLYLARNQLTGCIPEGLRDIANNDLGQLNLPDCGAATPGSTATLTPDLVVGTPTVDASAPAAGARFTLSATVRNRGNGSSGSTTLRYYRSTDSTITTGDTEVGTDSVGGLSAAGSGDESISLTAPSSPGVYYYGACVEAVTGESDTTNNCSPAVVVTVGSENTHDGSEYQVELLFFQKQTKELHFETYSDLAAGSYILYLDGEAFAFESSGTEDDFQLPGRQFELAQGRRGGSQPRAGRMTCAP